MSQLHRRGLSLIELLIVIAIVTMLIQLTLPAVHMAREAARKSQCANHLRQVGVAAQNHESVHNGFPAAGWGWAWVGDSNLGVGAKQPGSWAFQLLPYLEAQHVYQMGQGLDGEAKHRALTEMATMPLPLLYCPSRRLAEPTPTRIVKETNELVWHNAFRAEKLARMDYAANLGDHWIGWGRGPTPDKLEETFRGAKANPLLTGVVAQGTTVGFHQIIDGLSHTYFAAEKPLVIQQYLTGRNFRDDQSCWNGDSGDTLSGTEWPPTIDKPIGEWRRELKGQTPFGSAHFDGFNAVLCDGSVQFVSYEVEAEVHRSFGNRHDEQIIKTDHEQ